MTLPAGSASNGLSVVVPVFNSEATLPELLRRLSEVRASLGVPFEAVLVNDASRDRSWEVLTELAGRYPWLRAYRLMRNYGQHNAVLCGLRQARYDVIVTLDDDLQNPPEEIPRLLEELARGHDVVYGTPERERHGLWRDLASVVTKFALKSAMRVEVAREVTAFRAFRARLREAFEGYRSPFVSIDALLVWGTTRFTSVAVRHEPRREGTSNYTFWKLVTHAVNVATSFSALPLQLATAIGLVSAAFGAALFLFVVATTVIEGRGVPGFAFLASTISIFSGVQLFTIGILGEYLGRMHFRTLDRPQYVVRDELGR